MTAGRGLLWWGRALLRPGLRGPTAVLLGTILLAAPDAGEARAAVAAPAPGSANDVRRIFHRDYATRMVPLLLEAIRFPTVDGNAAAFTAQKAWVYRVGRELGLAVRDAGPVTEIELPGPPDAPVLGLIVHGDVQTVAEAEWSVPPFAGIEKDGSVWGRGSADDKGPLVQALLAVRSLGDSGLRRTHTIRLLVGSDEESHNEDMKTYLARHRAPDLSLVLDSAFPVVVGEKAWNTLVLTTDSPFAVRPGRPRPWALVSLEAGIATSIVPSKAVAVLRWQSPSLEGLPAAVAALGAEPSEGLSLETAIEGQLVTVTAQGRSAHAGVNLERGRNALVFLARSLAGRLEACGAADLLAFAALAGEDMYGTGLGLTTSDPLWGRYAVNVATIQTADGGRLALTINLRRTPPRTGSELRAHLESEVAAFNAKHGAHLVPTGFYDDEPLAFDPSSEIVRRLLAAYARATGSPGAPAISGGSTYAKRVPRSIAFGMWFPGQPYPGHDADERIPVEALLRGTEVLIEALVDLATAPPVPPPSPAGVRPAAILDGAGEPTTTADTRSAEMRFHTRSFVFARLSSAYSSALYAGYSLGVAGAFFGFVRNPRNGYQELIGGAVTRLVRGRQAVSVALAFARASDGDYIQAYVVPSLERGPWSFSGTIELYEPVGRPAIRQLYLDPLTLLRRLGTQWEVGASYSLSVAAGEPFRQRAGPAVQVALGGGALRAELLHDFTRSSNDVRAVYQTTF